MQQQKCFKRLVWFRNDLRIYDNPALFRAAENQEGVLAVYVICQEMIERHDVAPVRSDFVCRHLHLLNQALAKINIPLHILFVKKIKDISKHLLSLVKEHHIEELFFNAEYPLDEFNRDKQVADVLRAKGIVVKRFHDRVIIPPGMIRNGNNEPYKIFTAFKNNWIRHAKSLSLMPLAKPAKQPVNSSLQLTDEQITAAFSNITLQELKRLWPAGEKEALKRLAFFIEYHIHDYQQARDSPNLEATSTLSPYLAVGAISPRQCLNAALQANSGEWDAGSEGVRVWISELIWREFYQHVVVDYPHVCRNKAMQGYTEQFPWKYNQQNFQAWCEGKTGIPLIDAAMRQLHQTGWMHNRLRMVVAMYLTKNLQIDWRKGEAYFMRHLIDGDFAANNGGWQWSASTGTDAAPYFRIFNPISQSQRFDPDGSFIKCYLPQLKHLTAKQIHNPPASANYYAPIVDLSESRKETIALFSSLQR